MISYDRKKMGKLLRERRVSASYTQAEASRALGYTSPQFLSNIERGVSVAPIETLSRLIRLYRWDGNAVLDRIMAGSAETLHRALVQKRAHRRSR